MADSNEEEENQFPHFLNLPPPTTFSLTSLNDPLLNPTKQPIIFPPTNHENLHVIPSSDTSTSSSYPSSLSSYPSSSFDDSSAPTSPINNFQNPSQKLELGLESLTQKVNGEALTKKVNGVLNSGIWNLGLEALTEKVDGVVVFLRRFWVVRGVLRIFGSPVCQLLVVVLFLRWRRARGSVGVGLSDGSDQRLVRVIREKDEVAASLNCCRGSRSY
ncbi:hypothetical protein Leryth_014259 [Lithospermum erythrorhizon]|nr:hypothetical protein Leryth_014259 [Lithospermum erythrorhizon]